MYIKMELVFTYSEWAREMTEVSQQLLTFGFYSEIRGPANEYFNSLFKECGNMVDEKNNSRSIGWGEFTYLDND